LEKKGHAKLGVDEVRDVKFVKAVREAIGPDAGFTIDVGAKCKWDIPRAVSTASAMSEYRLAWIEEPFYPDNFNAYNHLRAAVPEMRVGLANASSICRITDDSLKPMFVMSS
jgi:L-alanine-DL-glutamate epimerase-like enolase superfamily enzyme